MSALEWHLFAHREHCFLCEVRAQGWVYQSWARRWKALAKSYRQRHVWNGEVIERQELFVRWFARSARRWKALGKRLWRDKHAAYVVTLHLRRSERAMLECIGCGLRNTAEPTVRERIDGRVRCGSCSAQWEGWRPPRGRELEWRDWLR